MLSLTREGHVRLPHVCPSQPGARKIIISKYGHRGVHKVYLGGLSAAFNPTSLQLQLQYELHTVFSVRHSLVMSWSSADTCMLMQMLLMLMLVRL